MPSRDPVVARSIVTADDLPPSPIDPSWIIEGDPKPRARRLALDEDRTVSAILWDCTTGRFNWHYGSDEIVEILDGEVELTFPSGVVQTVRKGDMIYFPGGQVVQFNVPTYLRKVTHYSSRASLARRLIRRLPMVRRVARIVRTRGSAA
jgi:uncharacterized cupin superfamily protein